MMMWETGNNNRRFRAFSLLEIMIVLLLIGLFTAVAVPTFRSLSGSKLKSTANKLMGLVRDTYMRSSLSGKTCRIVFDLDKKEYWVEESADLIKIKTEEDREEEDKLKRDAPSAKKAIKNPEFKSVSDELGEKQKLPDDIYFRSIWVETLEERVTEGQVSLYFFPDGYTEEAQIIISDDPDPDSDRLFDLIVNPLTGQVVIEDHEVPLEKI